MNATSFQALSADLSVSGQLDASAMAVAASAGFKSVINNRPDFEGGPDQPAHADIEAAARAAGLAYAYLPVSPGHHTPAEIARMGQLLAELPKPILAFCRSGARSSRLIQASISA